MAIGRHGQRAFGAFIILPRTVWCDRRLQSSFEFDHNSVCPGNADGGCWFFLLWLGQPSRFFTGIGHRFIDPLSMGGRLRAEAATVNHGEQHVRQRRILFEQPASTAVAGLAGSLALGVFAVVNAFGIAFAPALASHLEPVATADECEAKPAVFFVQASLAQGCGRMVGDRPGKLNQRNVRIGAEVRFLTCRFSCPFPPPKLMITFTLSGVFAFFDATCLAVMAQLGEINVAAPTPVPPVFLCPCQAPA